MANCRFGSNKNSHYIFLNNQHQPNLLFLKSLPHIIYPEEDPLPSLQEEIILLMSLVYPVWIAGMTVFGPISKQNEEKENWNKLFYKFQKFCANGICLLIGFEQVIFAFIFFFFPFFSFFNHSKK